MKVMLKVGFAEKDKVKELARENGTRIQWDGERKSWYWEGDSSSIPAFLAPYAMLTQDERSANDIYYIGEESGVRGFPFRVDKSFSSREELGAHIESLVSELEKDADWLCQHEETAWERAGLLGVKYIATAGKRIGEGKCIPLGHVRATQKLTDVVTNNCGARLAAVLGKIFPHEPIKHEDPDASSHATFLLALAESGAKSSFSSALDDIPVEMMVDVAVDFIKEWRGRDYDPKSIAGYNDARRMIMEAAHLPRRR